MSDLQSSIDALAAHMQPHAVSPVTATRLDTDSPPPNGMSTGYGTRKNTNANRRNGGGGATFRPKADYFAGSDSGNLRNPVLRPTAPNVTRANGIRVAGYTSLATAKALGDDNAQREWSSARGNLQRDAGDAIGTGESYPRNVSVKGRLAPSARY